MKSVEFEALIDSTGNISVPANLKATLSEKKVRVVLTYQTDGDSPSPDDTHYNKGYNQKDTLYDAY